MIFVWAVVCLKQPKTPIGQTNTTGYALGVKRVHDYQRQVGVPEMKWWGRNIADRHVHEFVRVGYGGAGWWLYKCPCGETEIEPG